MLTILLVCFIVYLASIGYGFLWHLCNHKNLELQNKSYNLLDQGIIGFCLLSVIPLYVSCFIPLGGITGYAILTVGIVSGIINLKRLKFHSFNITGIIFVTAIAILIAWPLATTEWSQTYDSDLYHFQQIKWLREQGTPLGLANLHIRLGVSSSFFALAAILEHGSLVGSSAWFMPVIYPLFSLIWLLLNIKKCIKQSQLRPLLYYLIAVSPFIVNCATKLYSQLYFDNPVGLIQIILVGEFLRLYLSQQENSKESILAFQNVCALSAFAITIKFSSLAISLITLALAIPIYQKRSKAALGLAAIILSAHLLRTVLLTGWILFPAPFGRLDVSWAVPAHNSQEASIEHSTEMQTVYGHYNVIKSWARLPGPDFHLVNSQGWSAWWPSWYSRFTQSLEFKLLTASLLLLTLSLIPIFGFPGIEKIRYFKSQKIFQLAAIIMIGFLPILFWFFSAPDLRFGTNLFWIFTALTIAYQANWINCSKLIAAITGIFIICTNGINLIPVQHANLYKLGKAPARQTEIYKLQDNLRVKVPVGNGEDRCGNTKIPCTPYLQKNLVAERENGRFLSFKIANNL